jgi:hypothetical protein
VIKRPSFELETTINFGVHEISSSPSSLSSPLPRFSESEEEKMDIDEENEEGTPHPVSPDHVNEFDKLTTEKEKEDGEAFRTPLTIRKYATNLKRAFEDSQSEDETEVDNIPVERKKKTKKQALTMKGKDLSVKV